MSSSNVETARSDLPNYFGSDGAPMSAKWKTIKAVFRFSESTSGPILPVAERMAALQQSMGRYPNIAPGQEFDGYST